MDLRQQLQSAFGDSYTIERELTGGGMSRVYLATETALGRRVVIKTLPPETAGHVATERFKREIALAAQLQQAHIVPLLSAGDVDGLAYFTMPFVDGESLRARLAREGELPIGEAVGILKDVARALSYAHQRGVVHRDIKPDNVLLSGGSAVVTDFGVAKALSASTNGGGFGLTSLGVALGTPAYMSPEQATADPQVDHRADLYAFGAMAYEMLTGQTPFGGRPPQAMLAAHTTEAPESIAKRRPTVPPQLSAIVMRCLEKRPADRPQSAADIAQALDAIVTPSGGMTPAGHSIARPMWTRPIAQLGAAVVIVAVVAAIIARQGGRSVASPLSRSIAVVPFDNLNGSTSDDSAFSKGVTGEITDALTAVPGLSVQARGRAADAWANAKDAIRVGQRLGVGWVLQAAVQRVGDSVIVHAQLVDASKGTEAFARKFGGPFKDIARVEDAVAKAIARELRITLAGGSATRIARATTENPEAHDLYLRAFHLWDQRGYKSISRAIELFQQAIHLDSGYARAHAGLALGYAVLEGYADISAADTLAKARAEATRALELDSAVVEAHAALGFIEMNLFKYDAAESEFRRAIQLDSTFAHAHQWYGNYLSIVGRHDEAIREMHVARDLDPTSRIIRIEMGVALYLANRYAEADTEFRRDLESDSAFARAHGNLGYVLLAERKYDAAVVELARARQGSRRSWEYASFAHALYLADRKTEARTLLDSLVERSKHGPVSETGLALLYEDFGEHEHAMAALTQAAAKFDAPLSRYAHVPLLQPLRRDPQGAALLDKVTR
jgi:serine/threonine-protein kinase